MIALGQKVRDKKTGFKGIVVDKKEHLYPNKIYYKQKMSTAAPKPDGEWFTMVYLVRSDTQGSMWFEEESLTRL